MPQLEREDGVTAQSRQSLPPAESTLALWSQGKGRPSEAASMEQSGNVANSLAGLLHDARNMVAAMDLYCELLAEPEVLSAEWRHYAADLRLVSSAGRRLLDKLAITAANTAYAPGTTADAAESRSGAAAAAMASSTLRQSGAAGAQDTQRGAKWETASLLTANHPSGRRAPTPLWPEGFHPSFPAPGNESATIEQVCEELHGILPLLSAIAGPGVSIEIAHASQDWPVPLNREDLTRVMVNLVRNASEAMTGSGRIRIAVEETAGFVVLSVADDGPGIPRELMERIFQAGFSQAGFSTRESQPAGPSGKAPEQAPVPAWPVKHRGLGLSIVRSIVSAARGTVWAANRGSAEASAELSAAAHAPHLSPGGAVFFLEFPRPHRHSSH